MPETKKNNETWIQYAKRCDYYRESGFDGRWITMTKKEIIEYEEILKQRERDENKFTFKKIISTRKQF